MTDPPELHNRKVRKPVAICDRFVVCNDGTVWRHITDSRKIVRWERQPNIPGTEAYYDEKH